jgi:hypothetical protein
MSKVLEVPDKSVRAMDRYGNDGALKAILTPAFAGLQREASSESGSCGAPQLCLHRAIGLSSALRVRKRRFCLIFQENVTVAEEGPMYRSAPHYCIARD